MTITTATTFFCGLEMSWSLLLICLLSLWFLILYVVCICQKFFVYSFIHSFIHQTNQYRSIHPYRSSILSFFVLFTHTHTHISISSFYLDQMINNFFFVAFGISFFFPLIYYSLFITFFSFIRFVCVCVSIWSKIQV